MSDFESYVWAEDERPKTVDDCILPERTKQMVKDAITNGSIPHFLMIGSAGTGKTSLCKAIATEIGADMLYINASLNTSIDTIRDSVIRFSSTISLSGSLKVVLLDEIDGLTVAAQNSLKGVVEEFGTTRFFMTSNNANKVIAPLHSRSVVLDFQIDSEEKPKLAAKFFTRVLGILNKRGIEYEKQSVAAVVQKYFPDFRRTLNELQRYSSGGKIDSGILVNKSAETIGKLIESIKKGDFKSARHWVGENSDMSDFVFKNLYDNCNEYLESESIPTLIILLADYQFKATHSVDQEINLMACITELMVNCKWKI